VEALPVDPFVKRGKLMATIETTRLNGMDVEELRQYIAAVRVDPHQAGRDRSVIARWVGGTPAEVVSKLGGSPAYLGGDDDPNPMGMRLRAMAACDVEVLVTRATLLGVEIEDLQTEATGFLNVARYFGIEAADGAGYQRAASTVRLKTRNATPEQIDELREALGTSPAGETFERRVPVTYDVTAS
jgi:uncharacterized OsmC-like protein